jgi:hypothetical protein
MEKEFVTYPLALRMKELGYDEPCMAWYGGEDIFRISGNYKNSTHTIWFCVSAPTWQSAFAWFREKHGYWSYIKEATKGTCRFYIEKFDEKFFNSDIIDSYEEAELACLEKLIEIVEQKQPCSTL